jgi:hypothetical protein
LLIAPTFADPIPDGGSLTALLDPDSALGFTAQLGLGWWRLPISHARVSGEIADRTWFAHGTPFQVVLGVGQHDVVVAPAGPDVLRFDPSQSESKAVRRSELVADLSGLASAVQRAALRERTTRLWCRLCGTFSTPRAGSDICSDCEDALTGRLY